MKSLIQAVVVAAVLAAPVASFAKQPNELVTRAQVRAELVQLEKAGYTPARGEDPNYPADLQAAEAKVAAQNAQTATAQARVADTSGVGGVVNGSSASGAPAVALANGPRSLYSGH
ncbi:DUF4148 domain-containing protein [Paraburkholderia sediminicola]|uniref:DUF4148 domain-containing protein n=1 Tax=Paraburkholderia sediminicola TaxID=458836 RepID=UPI0038BACCAB